MIALHKLCIILLSLLYYSLSVGQQTSLSSDADHYKVTITSIKGETTSLFFNQNTDTTAINKISSEE